MVSFWYLKSNDAFIRRTYFLKENDTKSEIKACVIQIWYSGWAHNWWYRTTIFDKFEHMNRSQNPIIHSFHYNFSIFSNIFFFCKKARVVLTRWERIMVYHTFVWATTKTNEEMKVHLKGLLSLIAVTAVVALGDKLFQRL